MRCQGMVDSPSDLGPDGHGCWSYLDLERDFVEAATAFLAEGLELGQALMFVGGPAAEEVVRTVEPMRSMLRDGSLAIAPFDAIYPGGRRAPHPDQWTTYAGATARAMDDGASGLRVLAEVTTLATPEGAWVGQARWESYADRRMAGRTLSALCCFDRGAVTPEGLGAIASAHPVVDRRLEELVPFRVFGDGDGITIVGEIDAFASHTLRHLLRAKGDHERDLVLDLEGLTFIEHTGVQALHEYAAELRARGREVTFRGGPRALHRLAGALGLAL